MLAGMNLTRFLFTSTFLVVLTSCQTLPPKPKAAGSAVSTKDVITRLVGNFDNHAQVTKSGSARWRYSIRQTNEADWLAWSIRLESPRPLQLELSVRVDRSADGSVELTPFRRVDATPAIGESFDPKHWTELAACSLSGREAAGVLKLSADRSRCATLAPALGELAGLLPMEITISGGALQVRSYSDQALGADYRTDAHRARGFGGWAAINGAGPQAKADSSDWHMNRDLRIDSEGGRTNLNFRDGQSSGYSLLLETITVQDGDLPLLKLSIVDSAGQVIAYAWSDPDAKRIGINLGWIQVGLQSS